MIAPIQLFRLVDSAASGHAPEKTYLEESQTFVTHSSPFQYIQPCQQQQRVSARPLFELDACRARLCSEGAFPKGSSPDVCFNAHAASASQVQIEEGSGVQLWAMLSAASADTELSVLECNFALGFDSFALPVGFEGLTDDVPLGIVCQSC